MTQTSHSTTKKPVSLGGVFSAPEHNPPPLVSVKKPMSELAVSAERLSKVPKPATPRDDHMLSPRVKRSAEEINQSVNRLHDQAVERRKKQLQQSQEKCEAPLATTVQLPADQISARVESLYTQAIQKHQQTEKKLQEKYLFHGPSTPRVGDKVIADRLYSAALGKRKEVMEKIYHKYVDESLPKYRKITPEEVKASGARLSTSPQRSS